MKKHIVWISSCIGLLLGACGSLPPPQTTPIPTEQTTPVPTLQITPTPSLPTPTDHPVSHQTAGIYAVSRGDVVHYHLEDDSHHTIATAVDDIAISTDGRYFALVRYGNDTDTLHIARYSDETLTPISELTAPHIRDVSWSPDGKGVVFTQSDIAWPDPTAYAQLRAYCAQSHVMWLDLDTDATPRLLMDGCTPQFAHQQPVIALVAPDPADPETNSLYVYDLRTNNSTAIVSANDTLADTLYRPVWDTDDRSIIVHGFLGFAGDIASHVALRYASDVPWDTRLATTNPIVTMLGFVSTAHIDGQHYVASTIIEDESQATGWAQRFAVRHLMEGEYFIATDAPPWMYYLMSETDQSELSAIGTPQWGIAGGASIANSPDGTQAVVLLPPDWQATAPEPEFDALQHTQAGQLWLWDAEERTPTRLILSDVDYGSPLIWIE